MFMGARFSVLVAAIFATTFCWFVAEATPVLDESFTPPGSFSLNAADYIIQQEVTADMNGILAGVMLWDQGTDDVTIYKGTPVAPGTVLFSTRISLNYGVFVDTSSANIALQAGDQFTIELSNGTVHCCTVPESSTVDLGETLYIGGGDSGFPLLQYQYTNQTLAFQTYLEQPVATPAPAGFPLFATGVGGLALARWRKRRMVMA
jgi:hypothetical protein